MELKFRVDTKHRKDWFTGVSFSHPAKMSLPLQLWIIENYTKAGETILDPMAGSGTILVACSLGRNVIAIELEKKFIDIMNGNWEKIKQRGAQLGYSMGDCQIIQGDARQLEGLLVDKIVTSPPYAETDISQTHMTSKDRGDPNNPNYRPSWKRKIAEGYCETKRPYGEIDKCIFSPPYADSPGTPSLGSVNKDDWGNEGKDIVARRGLERGYSKDTDKQIGNLPYGQIDKIVTSPPYEGIEKASKSGIDWSKKRDKQKTMAARIQTIENIAGGYAESLNNIGNLKSESYLEAMLQVYQNCFSVLKNGGLMVLVCKNFIRQKKVVRLDLDTIKLCEQAGFNFVERHYRRLPSQSFWRVIYHQKHPEVEQILNEDVLVFVK